MSVLIKGMKMPETCEECSFHCYHSDGEYVCVATPLFYPMNLANSKGRRKDFCPLVEIPEPHGRLIDADALDTRVRQAGGMGNVEEECTEDFNDGVLFVLDYFVKNAPTVIQREGR